MCLLLYIVKHIAICLTPFAKKTIVANMLMKIVIYCTKFKLDEAIGNSKAKLDAKLIELVLKYAKSRLNLAIGNAKAKLDVMVHMRVGQKLLKINKLIVFLVSNDEFWTLHLRLQTITNKKMATTLPCIIILV